MYLDRNHYSLFCHSDSRLGSKTLFPFVTDFVNTVKILNIGTCMSEQTVKILIRLLLRSSLIRIYTVCHSFCIFWRHYFLVKLNCLILRTTMVAGLGVPIFRVFTVHR